MTVHNLQLFVVCLLSSWLSHLCLYRYSWLNEDNISDLFEYFFVGKREDAGQKKKGWWSSILQDRIKYYPSSHQIKQIKTKKPCKNPLQKPQA